MKDWKKCTAFLLALVICLGLAACGVGSSEGEREDYYTPEHFAGQSCVHR